MLYLTKQFKFLSRFQSFWAIVLICNPSGSKVRHSRWIFLGLQIALQMKCNGQIAELNRSNEHVLAEALWTQFFWNFSHHVHIILTLSQDYLPLFEFSSVHGLLSARMCFKQGQNWSLFSKYALIRYTFFVKSQHS